MSLALLMHKNNWDISFFENMATNMRDDFKLQGNVLVTVSCNFMSSGSWNHISNTMRLCLDGLYGSYLDIVDTMKLEASFDTYVEYAIAHEWGHSTRDNHSFLQMKKEYSSLSLESYKLNDIAETNRYLNLKDELILEEEIQAWINAADLLIKRGRFESTTFNKICSYSLQTYCRFRS